MIAMMRVGTKSPPPSAIICTRDVWKIGFGRRWQCLRRQLSPVEKSLFRPSQFFIRKRKYSGITTRFPRAGDTVRSLDLESRPAANEDGVVCKENENVYGFPRPFRHSKRILRRVIPSCWFIYCRAGQQHTLYTSVFPAAQTASSRRKQTLYKDNISLGLSAGI